MPDYKYEGTYPRVFPYELGAGFEVTPAEGNPPVGPLGSTVYLSHGDILHADEPVVHAWLKEVDAPLTRKATKPVEPSTPPPVESSTPAPETPADPATSPEDEENK